MNSPGLYGANTTTRLGDTVYGFNSNADRSVFHLTSSSDQRVMAIWDAGGYNTIDMSGYSTNQVINLNPGTFSSTGALTQNLAIAAGTPGLFNALVLAGESGMLQGGVDVAAGLTRGIPETANI